MDDKDCPKCENVGEEPHSCPYMADVNEDPNPQFCTCCASCTADCADDI